MNLGIKLHKISELYCGHLFLLLNITIIHNNAKFDLLNVQHAGSECNYSMLTFEGVDVMGERLAKEVRDCDSLYN